MRGLYDCALQHNLKLEILCGVTVSLAQVPEAVAFALLAGLSPAIGVNSAWIIGTITAICGGRPAMICGATGELAVVIGLAQFNSFKKIEKARKLGGSFGAFTNGEPWIEGKELAFSLVICVLAFGVW